MAGWTKSYRSILAHPLLRTFDERGLWETLRLKAAYKKTRVCFRGSFITLERGQLAISVRAEAEEGGMTHKRIRLILAQWEAQEMIRMGTVKGKAYTLITICNYDKFQGSDDDEGTVSGTERAQSGHSLGQTEQEAKKSRTIDIGQTEPVGSNVVHLKPQAPAPDATFDAWWAEYPRKVAKGQAHKSYVAKIRAKVSPQTLIEGLKRSKAQWAKERRQTEFLPHASTWLNAEGWNDDYTRSPDAAGDDRMVPGSRAASLPG